MSRNFCPDCGEQLTSESINLGEGVALCPSCGQLSRLSEVVGLSRPVNVTLKDPPSGCTVTEHGQTIIVHASLRSLVGFVVSLGAALFWNGIVSLFVLIALAGLYTNLIGPLPDWFPTPDDDDIQSLGVTIFLCLFLTPFVIIGMILAGAVLLNVIGKVEVAIGVDNASVRTGAGFLVWRRRFNPTKVHAVRTGTTSWESNGRPGQTIVIDADRRIKFGTLLQEDRREWLLVILRELLAKTDPRERREKLSIATKSTLRS